MFLETMENLWISSGFATLDLPHIIMLLLAFVLIYLAIVKQFEPLVLLPIAFGMLLANLPITGIMAEPANGAPGGLLYYLYQGVKLGIYPSLIFMGIGAMTDFGPLLARPSSLLLGAAAQLGIYIAFIVSRLLGFNVQEAASIGIIGGADGPTAIFLTTKLAPHLLPAITIAAYSYMALIPMIQPPIMRLLTTKKERQTVMGQMRTVSKAERIIFPILVTVISVLLLPSVAPLIGMLMLGNLFRECGVVDRLSKTAQNELINIVTIFLGVTVGATATAEQFLKLETLKIIALGLFAFGFSTIGGVLFGKLMYVVTRGKVNPLIGSAGVSAVPMAARVSQIEGQRANPANYLLMHAMGPNVAGVIGSAVAAGFLLAMFGG
ncbi:MAG: sodium ion-translocating decarboxylase subunit beta [Saccharofermentanales bacterium]|jgi:sodium ion-translocating decarboxylase beta subunit|nr:sodium ion-translocating decarboxylase subunit beta [Clostridiaceae bacterium]